MPATSRGSRVTSRPARANRNDISPGSSAARNRAKGLSLYSGRVRRKSGPVATCRSFLLAVDDSLLEFLRASVSSISARGMLKVARQTPRSCCHAGQTTVVSW